MNSKQENKHAPLCKRVAGKGTSQVRALAHIDLVAWVRVTQNMHELLNPLGAVLSHSLRLAVINIATTDLHLNDRRNSGHVGEWGGANGGEGSGYRETRVG